MTDDSHPPTPWRGRGILLLGIALAALNLRTAVAAISPVLDNVRADIDISQTQTGVLGIAPVVAFAIFGSITPPLGRRLGLEPLLIIAMLASAVGTVARASSDSAVELIGWSLVAFSGMGIGNVLLPPLVKRYFPDRIGAVTAVYTTALALSTTIPALSVVPLAARSGWRLSVGMWAVVAVVAALPWVVVVWRSARARGKLTSILRRSEGGGRTARTGLRSRGGGRPWRSPVAWSMGIFFAINSGTSYSMFAWLPQILSDGGYDQETAAHWLAVYAAFGLPLSLVTPQLAARLRRPYYLVIFFAFFSAVGLIGMAVGPPATSAWWVIAIGLGSGTFPMVLAMVNLRTRTPAGSTALSGFSQGVGYTTAAIGPVAVGMLNELTGSWQLPLLFLTGGMVVQLISGWVMCQPRMLEDEWFRRA